MNTLNFIRFKVDRKVRYMVVCNGSNLILPPFLNISKIYFLDSFIIVVLIWFEYTNFCYTQQKLLRR